MNPESDMRNLKGLLSSAIYFSELQRVYRPEPKPSRKRPKSKKTVANRAKNKQARKKRKKNRK